MWTMRSQILTAREQITVAAFAKVAGDETATSVRVLAIGYGASPHVAPHHASGTIPRCCVYFLHAAFPGKKKKHVNEDGAKRR